MVFNEIDDWRLVETLVKKVEGRCLDSVSLGELQQDLRVLAEGDPHHMVEVIPASYLTTSTLFEVEDQAKRALDVVKSHPRGEVLSGMRPA